MPQKISGTKDVHFFSVGVLQGRTLIVYMKKKGVRLPPNINPVVSHGFVDGQHIPRVRACG